MKALTLADEPVAESRENRLLMHGTSLLPQVKSPCIHSHRDQLGRDRPPHHAHRRANQP